ncbi:adenylyl-sulfate kinase [Fusobacterium animalis]|uniref:adenylyl-sulfate kinase n=1 Tax=Fusobacterium animalis TaxID=76859 RepID=UPI0030D1F32E
MGRVFWITGLSGAGKTTIGYLLYTKLKMQKNSIVFLDGDELRKIFGNDLGYSKEDRLKSATRNSRLCKLLSDQGIDVICCTISMFDTIRKWNRENIKNYFEIYLDVSLETLKNRKNIYVENNNDIVGINVLAEIPKNPDIVLNNNGDFSPIEQVKKILSYIDSEV